MCELTAFICIIKENPAIKKEDQLYLKMKNALEGPSSLTSRIVKIYVKTLTGKTIEV